MENEEIRFDYPRKCDELKIKKSQGVNASEEKLCRLGYRTFLRLWSYPRVIYGSNDPTICYVLFLLPRKEYMEEDSYRKLRIDMLRDYCLIAKSERPNVNMVIGIAHESNEALGSSEDFMTLDAGEWSAEDQNHAVELKQEYMRLGLIGKRSYTGCSYHSTHDPTIRRMKGKDRNKPCPCGSGEKYKKCCGKIR